MNSVESDIVTDLKQRGFYLRSDEERRIIVKQGRIKPVLDVLRKDGKRTRQFQVSWYGVHKWLTGSAVSNKLYCWSCLLLSAKKSVWTTDGYCDWKNLARSATLHGSSKEHRRNELSLRHLERESASLDELLGEQRRLARLEHDADVRDNREMLKRLAQASAALARPQLARRDTHAATHRENVSGTESEETLHGDSSAREAQERLPPAEPKQEAEETPQGPLLVLPPQGHPSYVEEFRVSETPRIVGPPFTSVPCSLPYTPSTQLPEQQHQQQSLDTGTVQVKKEPQPEFLYTPQPSDAVFKGLNFDEQDNNPHFISLGNQVGLLAHQIGKLTEQVGEMSRALVQKTSCEQFQMEQMTVNHNISATLSLLAKAVLSKDFSGSKPVTDCSTQTEFSN
ncbi:uncharacterized protein LOC136754734 isoform X3 [Amia ocellicauda]|uniref:uncharacterized protein LOC136754734 isoform X3 n=1 Tax=Amia ocellicauda TaxID=2972642 RepID=UPI003463FF1A